MENTTLVPAKELEQFKKEVTSAEKFSLGLEVKTQEDYKAATDEGIEIKARLDAVIARRKEISDPLYKSYKSVIALFKPLEDAGELALKTIKGKMLDFKKAEARKADEAKQKLAERVERGTMKPETAVRKIEAMPEQTATVKTETGKSTMKKVTKYRLIDVYALPKEFLKPELKLSDVADKKKVEASFKLGTPVPGVEQYEEDELSFG